MLIKNLHFAVMSVGIFGEFAGDTNAMFPVDKPMREQPKQLMNATFGFSELR